MKFPWTTSIVDVLKDDNKVDEKLQHVAKSLVKKRGDISVVVEELGPALTHKDVDIRLKGTKFLSDLLQNIPIDFLSQAQIEFIIQFYCDRMKDHHSINPEVINGILAVVKMKNFPHSLAPIILQQLATNIPCQTQVRGDRANIFQIVQTLSDTCHAELETMGADFIFNVIQTVDGERDPRNLLFLFEFMPKFISSYPLKHFVEEMFEVFSCYFPIDFHPSPNDPKAITRDLLSEKLELCLCANKDFAQYCYPLALEKLDTDLTVAKLDSLSLMSRGAMTFEATATLEHFDEMWQAIKALIFPRSNNKDITEKSLDVMVSVIKKIKDDQAHLEIVLNKIFTTTIGTLLNRDSNLFKPTMELVLKCAEASDVSCAYVINKILPITITDLTSNEEITETERNDVLEDFFKFTSILKNKNLLSNYAHDNYMINIQKELMKILITPGNEELIQTTWKVLKNIAPILCDESRQLIYTKLKRDLMTSSQEESDCLLALSGSFPDEVLKIVLDEFLSKKYEDAALTKNTFTTLSALLVVPELREHIIEVMCINLFNNQNMDVQIVVLDVIKNILSSTKTPEIPHILFNEWRIVIKLIDLIKNANAEISQDLMFQASLVMSLVVKTLSKEQQVELVDKYLPHMKLQSSISDLYVTSGLLGFLDPEVPMEGHFEQLVNDLTKLSLVSGDAMTRKIANQLICSLFNRAPIDDKHRKILKKIFEILKDEIKKHNHQAVDILGWLSKGLLARGHPDAAELLETLAELLDHPKLSKAAELAFEVISLELPYLHLPIVKHLFKQKIFVLAMKFLEDKIEKFSEHHLTAMAHILQITPHTVLKMNIEKVGPILFKCIESGKNHSNPHAKRVLLSLKIFNNFILEQHPFIQTNLNKLIKLFNELVTFIISMEVRIMACKCLENLTKFPLFTLVPFKNDVTHELSAVLDDNKRLVRNAAVSARMAWYLLGENEKT